MAAAAPRHQATALVVPGVAAGTGRRPKQPLPDQATAVPLTPRHGRCRAPLPPAPRYLLAVLLVPHQAHLPVAALPHGSEEAVGSQGHPPAARARSVPGGRQRGCHCHRDAHGSVLPQRVRRGGAQSGPPHISMVQAPHGAAAAILEAGEAAMLRVGSEPEGGVRREASSRGEAGFPSYYGPRNKAVPV